MEIQSTNFVPLNSNSGEIPLELDFFKYAQGSHGKRKSLDSTPQEGKRRKFHHEARDEIKTTQVEEKTPATAHRVATKGESIPAHVESFAALKTYSISSHLLSNLVSSGYTEPTSVQSYCIPILLEVIDLAFVVRL
jgi:ATP-dependent RNA helicase DDX52/ROK1